MATQSWFPKLMEMAIAIPILLGRIGIAIAIFNSSFIRKPLLTAPGMESFREKLSSKGISEGLPISSPMQEEMEQTLITNRPIVSVVGDRLIPLHVMYL